MSGIMLPTVLMADGSIKNLHEVKVGEMVMGVDCPLKVLSVKKQTGKVYSISPVRSQSYLIGEQQKLCLFDSRDLAISRTTTVKDHLKSTKSDQRNYRLRVQGYDYGHRPQIACSPWLFGLYCSRGLMTSLDYTPVGFSTSNKLLLREIKKECQNEGLKYREQKTGNQGTIRCKICSAWSDLRYCFEDYGLLHNPKGRVIPSIVLTWDRKSRLEALAGVLDGRGVTKKEVYAYNTTNPALAQSVMRLARSLDINVSCCRMDKAWWVLFSPRDLKEVPCRIADIPPERPTIRYQGTRMFKVEEAGEREYYELELDGDKRYLDSEFIVHEGL